MQYVLIYHDFIWKIIVSLLGSYQVTISLSFNNQSQASYALYHRQAVVRPLWYGKDKQQ